MPRSLRLLFAVCLVAPAAGLVAADNPKPAVPPPAKLAPAEPWYVDDEAIFDNLYEKVTALAKRKKCLTHERLKAKMKPAGVSLTLAKPGDKAMTPDEVYRHALPSVFVIGSVSKDKKSGEWVSGVYASAWAVSADGVLVTNWHVFEELEPDEVFGAADHKGNVYPVVDFLGGDKTADVAVVKVDGSGFTPLPVATEAAPVASWVGVLSHPGDHFFTFTQGHVTRYSKNVNDDGKTERWMGITAEYASGSSGGPVLNNRGAVVGMTALTVTLDSPSDEKKPVEEKQQDRRRLLRKARAQDKPAPKEGPKAKPGPGEREMPEAKGPLVQMILKLTVPGPAIRQIFGK